MKKLKEILDLSSQKSESSELFYMNSFLDNVTFEGNEIHSIRATQSEGIGLRLRKNGRIGFATSTKLHEEIIDNALASAEFGNTSEFDFSHKNTSQDKYGDKNIDNPDHDCLISKGETIIRQIGEFDKRISVNIKFINNSEDVHLLTSCGFNGNYKKNRCWMEFSTAFTRKNDIFWIYKYLDRDKIENEQEVIEETIFDISHGMDIVKIDTGKYPVLFYPGAVSDFMQIFLSGISGYGVFRKTSPLHSRSGEKIFDERLNIYDDGTCPGSFKGFPFDDEGTVSQKTPLVEEGILKNFLLDLECAKKLNKSPTGNAFRNKSQWTIGRSYEKYPVIDFSTLLIKPGTVLKDQLLENIKVGLLVKGVSSIVMGYMSNGDFSGTIGLGYKVENGKITGRVKNTAITGNLYSLFKEELLEISSDICHNLGCSLPYMLFRDVEITS